MSEGSRLVLPDVIVIGAMKCATSAVHSYLDAHPDISMSALKELNFFNGPRRPPHADADTWWVSGQWHRGLEWYSRQFDPSASVRGESSPAYTSPTCPEVAARMAAVVPDVRLVYLVRDPVERAISQYAHHRRDGTEARAIEGALLDPGSQYLARSRYHERLEPFLREFRREQLLVVVRERLERRRRQEVAALYQHVGVGTDVGRWAQRLDERVHVGGSGRPPLASWAEQAFREQVADDTERLRELMGDELTEWTARRPA